MTQEALTSAEPENGQPTQVDVTRCLHTVHVCKCALHTWRDSDTSCFHLGGSVNHTRLSHSLPLVSGSNTPCGQGQPPPPRAVLGLQRHLVVWKVTLGS